MLTLFNCCIYVALCIDAQLVVSIRLESMYGNAGSGFQRVLLAASKHKRSRGRDEIDTKEWEGKTRHRQVASHLSQC